MGNLGKGALVAMVLLLIVLMPLAVIWALNTLFTLGIAYGFYEWLAVLVLSAFLQTRTVTNNK